MDGIDWKARALAAEESLATQVKITAEVLERERQMQEALAEARDWLQGPSCNGQHEHCPRCSMLKRVDAALSAVQGKEQG